MSNVLPLEAALPSSLDLLRLTDLPKRSGVVRSNPTRSETRELEVLLLPLLLLLLLLETRLGYQQLTKQ